jgi:hypothetical protein
MNREQFIGFMESPAKLNAESSHLLEGIVKEFPYCQTAQMLYLKSLHNQKSIHYNNRLKIASAYSSDRKILYRFIIQDNLQAKIIEINDSARDKKETIVKAELKETTNKEGTTIAPVVKKEETEHVAIIQPEIEKVKPSSFKKETIPLKEEAPSVKADKTSISKEGNKISDRLKTNDEIKKEIQEKLKNELDIIKSKGINKPVSSLAPISVSQKGEKEEKNENSIAEEVIAKHVASKEIATKPLEIQDGIAEKPALTEAGSLIVDETPVDEAPIDAFKSNPETPQKFDMPVLTLTDAASPLSTVDENHTEQVVLDVIKDNYGEVPLEPNEISVEVKEDKKDDFIPELETEILKEALNASYGFDILPSTDPEQKQETETELKEPVPEQISQEVNFTDWLRSLKKIKWNNEETDPTGNIKEQQSTQGPELNGLIEKFIREEPKIKAKKEFFSPVNMARMSLVEKDDFVTETLARVYVKQGNVAKAIRIYENLILKYPEKSAYFAAQILNLKEKNK